MKIEHRSLKRFVMLVDHKSWKVYYMGAIHWIIMSFKVMKVTTTPLLRFFALRSNCGCLEWFIYVVNNYFQFALQCFIALYFVKQSKLVCMMLIWNTSAGWIQHSYRWCTRQQSPHRLTKHHRHWTPNPLGSYGYDHEKSSLLRDYRGSYPP